MSHTIRPMTWAFGLLIAIVLGCSTDKAKDEAPAREEPEEEPRPTVGLVLGGGGAKAAAEIGVLKVLDSLGVHIDYVAGSSMGAAVGCLYAAGYSSDEIERLMLEEDWFKIFDKKDFGKLFAKGRKATGVVKRNNFQQHLDSLLTLKRARLFAHLGKGKTVPFRCTATAIDKYDMDTVVLKEGVVARAVAASLSFPGAYMPLEHEGRLLLDGGMMNNLPVDVMEAMKPDFIIAVDLEDDGLTDDLRLPELDIPLVKSLPWVKALVKWAEERPDVEKRAENIRKADLYIQPLLGRYRITDFDRDKCLEMIEIGRQTALYHKRQLKRLR